MGLSEGLNLLALVIVPLVAVVVGQYLQTRSKKKMSSTRSSRNCCGAECLESMLRALKHKT